jgi:predicted P-loop ATPase
MNDELERIWKKAVAAYFKAPSWHLLEEAEENHEKPQ